MKKILFAFAIALMAVSGLSAQNVVRGKGLDDKGRPIPGAKVEVSGTSEFVVSRLDGSFELESTAPVKKVKVWYAGMQPKSMKTSDDMLVSMRSARKWNFDNERYHTLVSAQLAIPDFKDVTLAYGFMVGGVKSGFGWYVKGLFNKRPASVGIIDGPRDGELETSYTSVTAGFLAQLCSPLYFYAGLGYGSRKVVLDMPYGGLELTEECYEDFAFDLGLMARFNRYFISAGTTINRHEKTPEFAGNLGFGVFF